jgi:hypothetical protein
MDSPKATNAIRNDLLKGHQLLVRNNHITCDLSAQSVRYCCFGNLKPLPIQEVNQMNGNQGYFNLERAEASRIYSLELEVVSFQ